MQIKTTTVRFPLDLDKALTNYAKREDMSKNQVIKRAVRLLIGKQQESEVVKNAKRKAPE